MSVIIQVVIMAFLVEAIWETLKMIWEKGAIEFDRIGALLVGLVIAFTLGIDIFVAIGLNPIIGGVGVVGTGILISRGGNYIHDLFETLNTKHTDEDPDLYI